MPINLLILSVESGSQRPSAAGLLEILQRVGVVDAAIKEVHLLQPEEPLHPFGQGQPDLARYADVLILLLSQPRQV